MGYFIGNNNIIVNIRDNTFINICNQNLEKFERIHLTCQHAFHHDCYLKYYDNEATDKCLVCD